MERNIPVDLIIYNQNEDPRSHETLNEEKQPSNDITLLAKDIHISNMANGKSREESITIIMSAAPFNQFPILAEILE